MEHSEEELEVLDLTLNLVAFYNILNGDLRQEIDGIAKKLEKCCFENPKFEVIHTGSGFEGLALPHLHTRNSAFPTWNTDADHMLIRTDIKVSESSEEVAKQEEMARRMKTVMTELPAQSTAGESVDENSVVYQIYDALHAGYVHVASKRLQHPDEESSVQEHCLKNSEFIKTSRDLIPVLNSILMAMNNHGYVSGPSYSVPYTGGTFVIDRDFVFGLKCTFWPSQAKEWINRDRQHFWPSSNLITSIVAKGCHIVPVGSHTSNLREFEWRLSFSIAELMIVESLADDQKLVYSVLKALLKFEMKRQGNDVFSSYHLKTALFWFLEQRGATSWEKRNLGESILELLESLTELYAGGSLPNYFVSNNNMLDHHSPKAIQNTCSILRDTKRSVTLSFCHYVETNQALPVTFDKSLSQIFKEHPAKFVQICRYNFLVMALVNILQRLKKSDSSLHGCKASYLVNKALQLHEASRDDRHQSASSLLIPSETTPARIPSANTVFTILEEFLTADQMEVTERSAVALAVFNVFLTLHPKTIDNISGEMNASDLQNYLTIPEFKDALFLAARLHEKYCDAIYHFVVKQWKYGPKFHTEDEEATKVMKLLMVVLGKPTKQAIAVTGSLAKRGMDGQMFLIMRALAEYLLYVHPESSYIAFQAVAYLMGTTVISEIYNFTNYGNKQSNHLATELILSKAELQAQLSDEESDRLLGIRHEFMDYTS